MGSLSAKASQAGRALPEPESRAVCQGHVIRLETSRTVGFEAIVPTAQGGESPSDGLHGPYQ